MIKSVMHHNVKDFETWKKAFDGFYAFRKSSGELSYSVGNLHNEPNTAYVINTWDSLEKLDAFVNSQELKDAMMSADVLEEPHTLILNEVDKG
jgi:quinol monooxygenase YgiN